MMLKDYVPVVEPMLVELDIDDIIRESAIVLDKICLANKIIGCLQEDENISYETASALVLPLYDYDKEFLNTEDARRESIVQGIAVDKSFIIKVTEIIKKLFRIFYNMLKQLQEKIVLWLHGIEPYILKLETRIANTDFSKVENFTESDHSRILNGLGVFCLFNGKFTNETVPRIITSFKNMKDIVTALAGYNDFITGLSQNLLSSRNADDIDDDNFMKGTEDSLSKKFFDKMPKFYKDISGQLKTFSSNKSIKSSVNFDRVFDAYIVSTNGVDLNILYSTQDSLIDTVKLRHTTGTILTDKFIKDVEVAPLDNSKISMLLKVIKDNNIKSLSDSIRSEFKTMETHLDKIMSDMNHTNFEKGTINLIGQLARATFSDNLSVLNSVCFNYINQNAKLTVNTLKFIEISLSKYETKEEQKPTNDQKLLK